MSVLCKPKVWEENKVINALRPMLKRSISFEGQSVTHWIITTLVQRRIWGWEFELPKTEPIYELFISFNLITFLHKVTKVIFLINRSSH